MTSKSPFCFASLEERTLAQSFLALLPRVLVQELRRILRSSVNLQDTMVPELCQKHCKNHWNFLRPEIQALYHGSFQERGTITGLKRMEQEAAAWSQNPICKITYPKFQVSSKQLLHFNVHSIVWIHDSTHPPFTLGKDPGTNVPQSASHLHVTCRVPRSPLDRWCSQIRNLTYRVHPFTIFLPTEPCFPTSSTDLGFSCNVGIQTTTSSYACKFAWKINGNLEIGHVFKGKINSSNKYAKYSGIVTPRKMLTLIIPKGQQPSSNKQQVQ